MAEFGGALRSRLAALVALVAALTACGGGGSGPAPGNTSAPTNPPAPNVVPSGAIYLGAFVNTSGVTPPPVTDLTALEAQIGRKLALYDRISPLLAAVEDCRRPYDSRCDCLLHKSLKSSLKARWTPPFDAKRSQEGLLPRVKIAWEDGLPRWVY